MSDRAMSKGGILGFGKRHKKKGGFRKPANSYFQWFLKVGRALFREQYGQDYQDGNQDHYDFITRLWNEARDADGGWEAAGRNIGRGGGPPVAVICLAPPPVDPLPPPNAERRSGKKAQFWRRPDNVMDGRCKKAFVQFTSKLRTTIAEEEDNGGDEDDVLRNLRCFVLFVNEHTSNAKGDCVCPSEVTLLSYSLSLGMQKVLSKIVIFNQSVVTTSNRTQLNDVEKCTLESQYEKTGIPAKDLSGEGNPEGADVIDIGKLRKKLHRLLLSPSRRSASQAPILLLRSNFNEVIGTLFTLFQEEWDDLKPRFCFLDDMFKLYSGVLNRESDAYPDLPYPPQCAFHEDLQTKLHGTKECTEQKAIRQLQCLFKALSDAKVLNMHRTYDPEKHEHCSEREWDEDGPLIEWRDLEKEQEEAEKTLEYFLGSDSEENDSDSDSDSLSETELQRPWPPSRRCANQSRGNRYGADERRGGGRSRSRDGYGGGEEYGRRETSEEIRRGRGDQSTGYSNSSFNGGARRNTSANGERMAYASMPQFGSRPCDRDPPPIPRTHSPTSPPKFIDEGSDEERGRGNHRSRSREVVGRRAGGVDRVRAPLPAFGHSLLSPRRAELPVLQSPSRPLQLQPNGFVGARSVVETVRPTIERRGPIPVFTGSRNSLGTPRATYHVPDLQHNRRDRNELPREEAIRREREAREWGGAGRQMIRERPQPLPRTMRSEDRSSSGFGFGGSAGLSSFYSRGLAPTRLIVPQLSQNDPEEETAKEAEEREEDELLCNTIKLLPRGTFDELFGEMAQNEDRTNYQSVHSEAGPASVESRGYPTQRQKANGESVERHMQAEYEGDGQW